VDLMAHDPILRVSGKVTNFLENDK